MNSVNAVLSKPFLLSTILNRRLASNLSEEITRQNNLFENEQKRQGGDVGRIDKIEVEYEGVPENATLIMNRSISTPMDCAKHLGQGVAEKSVVALLNNDTLWHMYRPLPDSCKLRFLHYNIPQPAAVNKIFWRSCSFILGAVVSGAFKNDVKVQLHSFPSPNVRSGSFVYDVQLSLEDWRPTQQELKVLSIEMIKFGQQDHPIECLDVTADLALDLFRNNRHKHRQIPDIAAHNNGKINLFRAGPHIDISRGPMIPNTNHLGRVTVASAIKLNTDIAGDPIYRFQGVALPRSIILNHFAYSLLEERARQLNSARIPEGQTTVAEDNTFMAGFSAQTSV